MQIMRVKIPICPNVRAFVLVKWKLYVINLSAAPDAKIIQLDFT